MRSIPEFYAGRCVFITGATGFMGKVLVEKLLRSCPTVATLYLLVRPKKGEPPQERIHKTLQCKLYDRVREEMPHFEDKVVAVSGDILLPGLGLSASDREELCAKVSIVFHSAATIKFDELLKLSVQMNVLGTRKMIELAHDMRKLEAFVHVSTAYANCERSEILERVYEPPIHPRKIIEAIEWMDDDMVVSITEKIVKPRPNTYTFTKALAEYLLVEEAGDLPIAIVRPSIVGASWQEPIPGWVDNFNGPTGLLAAIGKGLLRCMKGERSAIADLIPVDIAINMNIAVGWYTAVEQPKTLRVYNCTTGQINTCTWGDLEIASYANFMKNPLDDIFRVPNPRFTQSNIWHYLNLVFDHNLPAWLVDQWLRMLGRKPIMMKIQNRLQKGVRSLDYFTSNSWEFSNDNVRGLIGQLSEQDTRDFCFDARRIHWPTYTENYCLGTRTYALKEDLANMPRARQTLSRRQHINTVINFVLVIVVWRLLMRRFEMARNLWQFMMDWAIKLTGKLPGFVKS